MERHPDLLGRDDSLLLVIDVQERLLPSIPAADRLVWNIRRLLDGAKILGVPAAATEQYPRGLGATIPEIRERLPAPAEKLRFSCSECRDLLDRLPTEGIDKIVLTGIETHVCVLQSGLDLLAGGYRVHVVVDAVAARAELDHTTAVRRLEDCGAVPTTTETVLFEWTHAAGTPEFKQISQLVKETGPQG